MSLISVKSPKVTLNNFLTNSIIITELLQNLFVQWNTEMHLKPHLKLKVERASTLSLSLRIGNIELEMALVWQYAIWSYEGTCLTSVILLSIFSLMKYKSISICFVLACRIEFADRCKAPDCHTRWQELYE